MHDSGERESFNTGAVRDTAIGKPRIDLISPFAEARLGAWSALGAAKYSERNWEAGMPLGRILASLCRHLNAYRAGDTSEDHLAAVMWNAMALAHGEEMVKRGVWAAELADLPSYTPDPRPDTPAKPLPTRKTRFCRDCVDDLTFGHKHPCIECCGDLAKPHFRPKPLGGEPPL
jgi:hypothetical protein